jgi:hypothetical protein
VHFIESSALGNRSPSDLPAATRQCLPQNGWFRLWGVIRTARQSHGEHRALARLARHGHIARRRSDTSALKHRGRPGHESSKFFMQRTATTDLFTINLSPPFFLNHAQVDPESLQIDLEWACNLEQSHGRFNFDDSFLIVDQSGSICALSEFTFELS